MWNFFILFYILQILLVFCANYLLLVFKQDFAANYEKLSARFLTLLAASFLLKEMVGEMELISQMYTQPAKKYGKQFQANFLDS